VAAHNSTEDEDGDDGFGLNPDTSIWSNDVAPEMCSLRCQSLNFEVHAGDVVRQSDAGDNLPPLQRCQSLTCDNVDETDDDCQLSDADNGSFIISQRAMTEQNDVTSNSRTSKLVREQLQRSAEITWKVQFSEEKLYLLEKMIAAGNIKFPCTIRVVMAEKAVELIAVENNVIESEIGLYELVASFSSSSLHFPEGIVKLLLSSRGQKWLKMKLASVNAVFYAKERGAPPIVTGTDSKTSTYAKFLLENALSTKKISFKDQHTTFLRSTQWASTINKFESEFFVTVNTEYRENEIVVEGSVEALNDIVKSVEMMLRKNSMVQRKITMSAEQLLLLMHYRVDIQDKLKSSTAAELDVKFDEKLNCLTISGLTDSTEVAAKFVKTNYLDVICIDVLEIVQPGDLLHSLWRR